MCEIRHFKSNLTEHSPKQRTIAVNEVVPVSIPDSGDVSSEHGAQHGVRVALQC